MERFEVKASYHNRTIYYEVQADGLSKAMRAAEMIGHHTFKAAGHNMTQWEKQSKLKIKKKP